MVVNDTYRSQVEHGFRRRPDDPRRAAGAVEQCAHIGMHAPELGDQTVSGRVRGGLWTAGRTNAEKRQSNNRPGVTGDYTRYSPHPLMLHDTVY
jgi:hypothetical protein